MHFYSFIQNLANIVFRILFRVRIEGRENIPVHGRVILCSNHTNVFDPVVLAIAVTRPIAFMAKKELFQNRIFGKIIYRLGAFPIDRKGSDISAIRSSLRVLNEERILGLFPEGTRVKKMDLENAKAGVGLLGVKGRSPIVPVYINSTYKLFSKIVVKIGEPLSLDDYSNRKLITEDYKNISRDVLNAIYSLNTT